ncbi:MAG: caspase family protein [Hyphomicrobiaceae bacterium]
MPIQTGRPFDDDPVPLRSERIALVIGNKNYRVGALRNPGNDALRVAALLKRLGFEVDCRFDLTLEQMTSALKRFTRQCRHHDTALFYYAGHGMQVETVNLLVPVDFDLPEKDTTGGVNSAAIKSTINLAEILEATQGALRTLIFLDACREFPEPNGRRMATPQPELWRSMTGRGFAMLDADKERDNLVVSFAADAGKQALDGDRRNSPYTTAFADLAVTPISMGKLLEDLRHRVFEATDGRQRPREVNTLVAPFSLTDGNSVPGNTTPSGATEDHNFADAVGLDAPEAYRYYLAEFPNGRHAARAQHALARLTGNARVRIDAAITQCAEPPWFKPGRGKAEWFQDLPTAPQMVVVPACAPIVAGNLRPGEATTSLGPFAISRTPITFEQWQVAVAAGALPREPPDQGWGKGSRPVVNVSWHEAQAYVLWLSQSTGQTYRLPWVMEWEHCCRADVFSDAPANAAAKPLTRSLAASVPRNRPVALEQPNAFGLFDMLGHIWQWCMDSGPYSSDRAAKGGERGPGAFSVTEHYYAGRGEPFIGFRVAREVV